MATRKKKSSTPVTFDLPLDLLAKIETCRKTHGVGSASEVIRTALDQFDFAGCQPVVTPHRQISVRLNPDQRLTLKRFAKLKIVSVGELLRMAVEALPAKKERPKARGAKQTAVKPTS